MRCPWWDFDSLQYRDLSFHVAPIHGHRASTHLMWSGKSSETSRQYIIQHGWLGPALWVYNAHMYYVLCICMCFFLLKRRIFCVMCVCWRVIIQYSTDINSVAMCVFPCLFLMETLGLCTPAVVFLIRRSSTVWGGLVVGTDSGVASCFIWELKMEKPGIL